jgi:mersacidin/lichenicidin family type 2 lantibiotic
VALNEVNKESFMSQLDIVRAWKDATYRRGLTPAQRASLPFSPVGELRLSDEEMLVASGLKNETRYITTAWFCTLYTFLARCC